ncbi:unnamed protein product, partial [Staurois parvus]
MTLSRKGLISWRSKELTVYCVCFTMCTVLCFTLETCFFVSLCCAERYKTCVHVFQEGDLCCLYTGLSPVCLPKIAECQPGI